MSREEVLKKEIDFLERDNNNLLCEKESLLNEIERLKSDRDEALTIMSSIEEIWDFESAESLSKKFNEILGKQNYIISKLDKLDEVVNQIPLVLVEINDIKNTLIWKSNQVQSSPIKSKTSWLQIIRFW